MKKLFQTTSINAQGEKIVNYHLGKEPNLKPPAIEAITKLLEDESVEAVYRRGRNYYKLTKEGKEKRVLRCDYRYTSKKNTQ